MYLMHGNMNRSFRKSHGGPKDYNCAVGNVLVPGNYPQHGQGNSYISDGSWTLFFAWLVNLTPACNCVKINETESWREFVKPHRNMAFEN